MSTPLTVRTEPAGCCVPRVTAAERDAAADAAGRFCALGDPVRMQIVQLLARQPALCVCEIQQVFDLGQPTISHHLRILRDAGLVGSEKRGVWAYYFLRRDALKGLAGRLMDLM
jgi:ArsR family transcriptional regulator